MSSIASSQAAHPALNTSIFRVAAIALAPSISGAARAERSPMAARWQTLLLGGSSQVKRGVREPSALERRCSSSGYDRNHILASVPSAQSRLQPQEAIMIRVALFASLVIVVTTATSPAQTVSPYTGQERRTIKALSDEEIRDLLEARGMGLAKAAELNSYPGPLHVLQLATGLGLSDAQRKATDSLYATMRQRALSIGRQILEAERTLDRAFVNGAIEPATLRSQVRAIATLQGELRAVHLEAHLAQHALLTPEQIAQYDALRGYRRSPAPHDPRHGG